MCSVLYPGRPVKHLLISTKAIATFNRKSFSLFAHLSLRDPAHRYQGGDDSVEDEDRAFFDRILAMMVEEALMGTLIDENDVPEDIKPHLAYPLPKFEFIKNTPLPFGSCTLPVYLIANFDRQGIPLPPLLAAIPKPELDILRSRILQPAKSPMLQALMYALNNIADPKQQAFARNRCYAWYDIVALCDQRPELFSTYVNGVPTAVTSLRTNKRYYRQTLWSVLEPRIFREIASYRCDSTDDLEVLQLVNDRLLNLRESKTVTRTGQGQTGSKNPDLEAWVEGGAFAIAVEAMRILLLQADPKDTGKKSTGKIKYKSTVETSCNGVSVWSSWNYMNTQTGRHQDNRADTYLEPLVVARMQSYPAIHQHGTAARLLFTRPEYSHPPPHHEGCFASSVRSCRQYMSSLYSSN
ncbi:hypothetical protein LTR97_002577 [Elasticomyces elasticus]|uniref:Uncharacterized protein n=1 Tax=Elasticomyces elasticus TaxID=574655 RepID=A0AAN7ZQ70_9PEZI|nr:hypothetical protein LTR97_002577 [Elasticomyces elasticus]